MVGWRGSSRLWLGVILTLAGTWFVIDGGWLAVSQSAGTSLGIGNLLGAALFLPGSVILVSEKSVGAREGVPSRRIARKWIVVVGVAFVALVIVGYLSASIPVVPRSYTAEVTTTSSSATSLWSHLPVGSATPIYVNDTGLAWVQVPQGATLSGHWSASGGLRIGIMVDYGAGYANGGNSSGSFRLAGGSPFGQPLGSVTQVPIWVLSPSPVTVVISGTFTAPLLSL